MKTIRVGTCDVGQMIRISKHAGGEVAVDDEFNGYTMYSPAIDDEFRGDGQCFVGNQPRDFVAGPDYWLDDDCDGEPSLEEQEEKLAMEWQEEKEFLEELETYRSEDDRAAHDMAITVNGMPLWAYLAENGKAIDGVNTFWEICIAREQWTAVTEGPNGPQEHEYEYDDSSDEVPGAPEHGDYYDVVAKEHRSPNKEAKARRRFVENRENRSRHSRHDDSYRVVKGDTRRTRVQRYRWLERQRQLGMTALAQDVLGQERFSSIIAQAMVVGLIANTEMKPKKKRRVA